LKEPIAVLKNWNKQYGVSSVGTQLAVNWAKKLQPKATIKPAEMLNHKGDQVFLIDMMIATTSGEQKLQALSEAVEVTSLNFGNWNIGWGEINRFQRPLGDIRNEIFDDSKPSLPIAQTSSLYGSLAAFGSRTYPGTKKMYGGVGNGFVAVVEFGPRIKAKSIVTGGSSADPKSKHFNDQALMYSQGQFKDVLFYKEDVVKNAELTYHPGEQ
jgi:acyl-homoserine lactone acylase PvdQ